MTKFDALKAAKEQLTGFNDVLRTISQREHAAEAAIALAELELNAVRKLRGFCQMCIDDTRAKIEALQNEDERPMRSNLGPGET